MQYSIPYTTIISLAYGYAPDPHLSLLTAIRSLSLYKVQNMPIHMIELSPPNTGKLHLQSVIGLLSTGNT